jgi:hypothetical protein
MGNIAGLCGQFCEEGGVVMFELRTLPSFLDVHALVNVVFNYLVRFGGGEGLVTVNLITLE